MKNLLTALLAIIGLILFRDSPQFDVIHVFDSARIMNRSMIWRHEYNSVSKSKRDITGGQL